MSRTATTLFGLVVCVACAGDPESAARAEAIALDVDFQRIDWADAPAGCEDLDDVEVQLLGLADEPSLGALVDVAGRIRCVDSLDLLLRERAGRRDRAPRKHDPTPTPLLPPTLDGDPLEGAAL